MSFVSSSVGFENDDIIRIQRSILTGEDGINGLDLEILSVTVENRIDDVDVEPFRNLCRKTTFRI